MLSGLDSALLRFALTHQDSGPLEDKPLTRDPKDYEWLQTAIKSIESDFDRMSRLVKVLNDSEDDSKTIKDSEVAFSLEELQYLIEDIDNANDFCKIENGLTLVLRKLQHPSFEVRKWAAHVVSTLVQNNPRSQKYAFEQKAFQVLIPLLQSEQHPEVQSKLITAVSGLVRHFPQAESAFVEGGGLKLLAKFLLDSENQSNRTMKALFLLTSLLTNHPAALPAFADATLPSLLALRQALQSSSHSSTTKEEGEEEDSTIDPHSDLKEKLEALLSLLQNHGKN